MIAGPGPRRGRTFPVARPGRRVRSGTVSHEPVQRRAGGAHQLAVGVRATVRPGRLTELRTVLADIDAGAPGAPAFGFEASPELLSPRLLVLDDSVAPDGRMIPASLVYMGD